MVATLGSVALLSETENAFSQVEVTKIEIPHFAANN